MDSYTIRDISSKIKIKEHLLRQWENSLGLQVSRNSHGVRIYDDEIVEIFKKIRELRDKNVPLDMIKEMLIKSNFIDPSKAVSKANKTFDNLDDFRSIFEEYQANIIKPIMAEMQKIQESNAELAQKLDAVQQNEQLLAQKLEDVYKIKEDLQEDMNTIKRQSEDHFKKIDEKLAALRNKPKKDFTKVSLWKRIFG